MKKQLTLLLSVFAILVIVLTDCRRDPLINKTHVNETDSAFIGTPYKIQIPFGFPNISNPYKDSLTTEGILLGRRLFYDKHLSVDGQMACASCHLLSHGFADSIPIATNEFGLNKRKAPTLINLAWSPFMFWDGRQPTLAAQAQDAFHNELGLNVAAAISYLQADTTYAKLFKKAFGRPGIVTEHEIYLSIQEFLMTVISANSRFDSVMRGQAAFDNNEYDAFYNLFTQNTAECFHCHAYGNNYVMASYVPGQVFRNNGLQVANTIDQYADPGRGGITGDSADYGLFKNPSLRNIAVRGPYMHDGRFKTLAQVINFYSDSLNASPNADPNIMLHMDTLNGQRLRTGGMHFTAQQKAEMLELLNDFTDTSFLNNPAYKNPF